MQDFLNKIRKSLSEIYSDSEIVAFAFLVLENITGRSRAQILAEKELKLTESEWQDANNFINRLKNHEPIQYILGKTEFDGLKFKVTPAVLIPRPETEELVEWIIRDYSTKGKIKILDIGTGSGCIAISLKKRLKNADVYALDVSDDALNLAKENAIINDADVHFVQADVLKMDDLDEKYDVIVSNPPYVLASDSRYMQHSVLDYEPNIALFVSDDNPLLFYRKIADLAKNNLTENGNLYFEIHHKQGSNVVQFLQSTGFREITLRKDLSGNDRMIRCLTPR